MKKRMRVLSMLVCLALLMSTVPVDLPFASAIATEAETAPEPVAADVPAPEPEEVPEEPHVEEAAPAPEPTEAPAEEPVETQAPEATEVPAAPEETVESDAPAQSEPAEQPEVSDAPQSPEETAAPAETEAPEPTEDPNAIDYSADASQSKAFRNGLAEVIHDDTLVFEGAGAQDEPRAKIGRGVVYVSDRTGENDSPDRVKIAFNAGPEVGVDGGWVDASAVRPMEPTQETPAYMNFCAERDDLQLLFYQDLAELPLARIACVYRASEETAAPEVTQAPAATEKPAEESAPEATEHPIFLPEEPVDDVTGGEPGVEDEAEIADEVIEDEVEDETEGETGMPEAQDELLDGADDAEAAIGQDELQMYTGHAQQLNLTLPDGSVPMLTSNNIRVATVTQDGVVKAIAPGEAMITLRAGDEVDECSIAVINATQITVKQDPIRLGVGESRSLPDLVDYTGDPVYLQFGNPTGSAVSVTGTTVKAASAGKASITVSDNAGAAPQTLNFVVYKAPASVTIKDSLELSEGMTGSFDIVFPANCYTTYELTDDDEAGAVLKGYEAKETCDEDGNLKKITVTVQAVDSLNVEGTSASATITITTGNGLTDTCYVTVSKKPGVIVIDEDCKDMTLTMGETGRKIVARAYATGDENGTLIPCELKFSANPENVVDIAADGTLTTKNPGTATVTVSADGVTEGATCTVTVKAAASAVTLNPSSITLGKGDVYDLKDAIVLKDNERVSSYKFKSKKTSVATVDANTGVVTAKAAGTANIEITPVKPDGTSGTVATLPVTVKNAATSIPLSESELRMGPGEKRTITVGFSKDKNGNPTNYADYEMKFVPEQGEGGFKLAQVDLCTWTVTAPAEVVAPATLVATTSLKGYVDTCVVKVLTGPESGDEIEIDAPSKTLLYMGGEGGKISATLTKPEEVREGFSYEATKKGILEIVANSDGSATYKPVGVGSTTITVTAKYPSEPGGEPVSKESAEITVIAAPQTFGINEGKGTLKLGVGDTYLLSPGAEGGDPDGIFNVDAKDYADYSYTVKNEKKKTNVTVDANGLLTAKKAGTAYVTVTPKSNSSLARTLTVKVSAATTSIALSAKQLTLRKGMTGKLTVSFSKSSTYGSFDFELQNYGTGAAATDVVDVVRNGEKLTLTAKQEGQALLVVSTDTKGYADTCIITVKEALAANAIAAALVVPHPVENAQDGPAGRIGVKEANQKVYIDDPDGEWSDVNFTFKSTATNVLKVNETTGALTANAAGTAQIQVFANGVEIKEASKRIDVVTPSKLQFYQTNQLEMNSGTTRQIVVSQHGDSDSHLFVTYDDKAITFDDGDAPAAITYSATNTSGGSTSVISVDKNTGLITAKAKGTAVVHAKLTNNSKVKADLTVVVKQDLTLKLNNASEKASTGAVTLGVGMPRTITLNTKNAATWLVDGEEVEPEQGGGKVKISDVKIASTTTATLTPLEPGTFTIQAKTDEGGIKKVSNIITLTVLRAPTVDELAFPEGTPKFIYPGQSNLSFAVTCPEGTMADLEYKVWTSETGETVPDGFTMNATTGKLKATESKTKSQAGNLSVWVVVRDKNNTNVKATREVKLEKKVKAISKLSFTSMKLGVGETFQITCGVEPENLVVLDPALKDKTDITFKSSSTSVAEVSPTGLITAKKAGTAKITIASSGNSKVLTVTVVAQPASVAMSPAEFTVGKGLTQDLTISFPKGGYSSIESVESSKDEVAEITVPAPNPLAPSNTALKCTVTGVDVGDAKITVTTWNGKSFASVAHVKDFDILLYDKNGNLITDESPVFKLGLNQTKVQLFTAKAVAEDGEVLNAKLKFAVSAESENPGALVVADAAKGTLTAKKAGKVTVTISAGDAADKTREVTVEVVAVPSQIGLYPGTSKDEVPKKITGSKSSGTVNLLVGDTYTFYEEGKTPEEEDPATYGVVDITADEAYTSYSYVTSSTTSKIASTAVISAAGTGVVTAKKVGTAYVRTSWKNAKNKTTYGSPWMTFKVYNQATSVKFEKTQLELGAGMKATMKVSFPTPSNAYDHVEIISSNDKVATAEMDPTGALKCEVKAGSEISETTEATLTIRTAHGVVDTCRVIVHPGAENIALTHVSQRGEELVEGDKITMALKEAGVKLVAAPSNADEGAMSEFEFAVDAGHAKWLKLTVDKNNPNMVTLATQTAATNAEDVTITVKDKNNAQPTREVTLHLVEGPTSIKIKKFNTTSTRLKMGIGDTFQLDEYDEEYNPEGLIEISAGKDADDNPKETQASYTYSTSSSKVATVSNGLIKAVGTGNCTITVKTQSGKSAYLYLNVCKYPTAMTVTPAVRLGQGMTYALKPTFTASGSYGMMDVTSTNEELLTTTLNESTGAITLEAQEIKAPTTATVQVRLKMKPEISDTCYVTLLPAPESISIDYDAMRAKTSAVQKDENKLVVGKGEKGVVIIPKLEPENTLCEFVYTIVYDDKPETKVTNMTVDAATGALTVKSGCATGNYTITVTASNNPGATATVPVEVVAVPSSISLKVGNNANNPIKMGVGETYQMKEYYEDPETGETSGTIVLTPANSSASYTFEASKYSNKSASTNVLSVDKNTGVITAKTTGTAYVKVIAQNNTKACVIATVKVYAAPTKIELTPSGQELGELSEGSVAVVYTPSTAYSAIEEITSSDPELVKVNSDGRFTVGKLQNKLVDQKVTITVKVCNGLSATATVLVKRAPEEVAFDLEGKEGYELSEGAKLATKVTFPKGGLAQKLAYSVENPTDEQNPVENEYIKIDKDGVITALSATPDGEPTRIYVTANPGVDGYEVTGEATVTVKGAPAKVEYDPEPVIKLFKGDTVPIPLPKAYDKYNAEVPASYRFTSGGAAVKINADGTMTASTSITKDTSVTITATAWNEEKNVAINKNVVKDTFTVTVTNKADGAAMTLWCDGEELPEGQNVHLYIEDDETATAHITGEVKGTYFNQGSLTFESSDADVASVDADGTITAWKTGETKITVSAKCGTTRTFMVYVHELASEATLKDGSITITEGDTQGIEITYSPKGASVPLSFKVTKGDDVVDVKLLEEDAAKNHMQYVSVTALKGGEATIEITNESTEKPIGTVTVNALWKPDRIKLPVSRLYLKPSESVTLTPVLTCEEEEQASKINIFTKLVSNSNEDVITVTPKENANQAEGTVESYDISVGDLVSEDPVELVFETYNHLTARLEIVTAESFDGEQTGFIWDENADLYIIQGDTAELDFGLTAEMFGDGSNFNFAIKLVTVDGSPAAEELLDLNADAFTITAKEQSGEVGIELVVNEDEVVDSRTIHVIENASLTIVDVDGDGNAIGDSVDMDVITNKLPYAKHTLKVKVMPLGEEREDAVLLGTLNVTSEDADGNDLLTFDRQTMLLSTTEKAGDCTLKVETFNGSTSRKVTVLDKPVYRALLISEFNGTKHGLPFIPNNISIMKEILGKSNINGQPYQIKELKNPSEKTIKDTISSYFKGAKRNDVSLIYFASHGRMGGSGHEDEFSFTMEGVTAKNKSTFIEDNELMSFVKASDAYKNKGNVVLLLDGCNTGAFITHQQKVGGLSSSGNIAVMAAQKANKTGGFHLKRNKDDVDFEFFTYAFCKGMGYDQLKKQWGTTVADTDKNGGVTLTEAYDYTKAEASRVALDCADNHFNGSGKGFVSPGVTTNSKRDNWKKDGGQKVEKHIPSGMANLVIFNEAS